MSAFEKGDFEAFVAVPVEVPGLVGGCVPVADGADGGEGVVGEAVAGVVTPGEGGEGASAGEGGGDQGGAGVGDEVGIGAG